MSRGLVLCIAALAFLSVGVCPAQGFVQGEGYAIGADTLLALNGGFGMIGEAKIAVINLDQATFKPGGSWAIQSDDAIFT